MSFYGLSCMVVFSLGTNSKSIVLQAEGAHQLIDDAKTKEAKEEMVDLDMVKAPVYKVAALYAEYTGRTVSITDDAKKILVTVVSEGKITKSEAIKLIKEAFALEDLMIMPMNRKVDEVLTWKELENRRFL